ncbi:MAG: hypothetical protein WDW36_008267 [Sanguina aurantia]
MAALAHSNIAAGSVTTRHGRPILRCAAPKRALVVRASADGVPDIGRRAVLTTLVGAASILPFAQTAMAAYGDGANIFGRTGNQTGYMPFVGKDFAVNIPTKWRPSLEKDFKGIQMRYEDNFFPVNNLMVITLPTDKSSITDFGPPDKFTMENLSYLLGKQSYSGETISEGGFAPNRVSAASLLEAEEETDKKGKKYYKAHLLTRTADGSEGGRHNLIKATVSNGQLYIMKFQAGEKRWLKVTDQEGAAVRDSFTVA